MQKSHGGKRANSGRIKGPETVKLRTFRYISFVYRNRDNKDQLSKESAQNLLDSANKLSANDCKNSDTFIKILCTEHKEQLRVRKDDLCWFNSMNSIHWEHLRELYFKQHGDYKANDKELWLNR